ncbi:Protein of unknown function DUF669 [uncultured Caudovirales phage]|jgi:hypothetical protein|uniref:Uncharacterized protein n=1 Tax=uncultured Caudovirales phage TaxID=2100421 RepID=A0A6J7XC04_9CAUD|nr:Protein of unknown function DUF669 [uncultured Caudovirales phage]CAB4176821.1 Protein of unknown function DUF669 [uncultured Caudovirales phage]CAB4181107.1 Protein of unknown function DUF669 [uncultured Caudovirales phage]CAB4198149.1 Protein of unknown function DUF669 [uncultured Caudovirales phage]CAB4210598.1 Protein of unknown function DUF669 [uncultured Caudovirales phage]
MNANEKLDWTNIENIMLNEEAKKTQLSQALLPNNIYDAIISGSELKQSKKGDNYLSIAFTILSPDAYKNRIIYDIYMQTHDNVEVVDRAKYKLRQVCMAVMGKLADYPVDLIGKKAKLSIKIIDDKDTNGILKINSEGKSLQKNVITRILSINEFVPNIPQSKLNYNESIEKKPLLDINNLDLEDAIPF